MHCLQSRILYRWFEMSQISSTINSCRRKSLPNFDSFMYFACIRTLSEHVPSFIFLNCGKMVIIVNLEEMRMCLFICNLGPCFIISRPMKEKKKGKLQNVHKYHINICDNWHHCVRYIKGKYPHYWTRTSSCNCTTRTSLFKKSTLFSKYI